MPHIDYKELTVRRRPHFQPLDATLFVTFRLTDSIPKSTVRYYKARLEWLRDQLRRVQRIVGSDCSVQQTKWLADIERLNREWFIKCEDILHRELIGPTWLREPEIADRVAENLHRHDGDTYRLDAYSIMSNHVHTVFKPLVSDGVIMEILEAPELASSIPALSKIMQAIKGRSARECNLILGRSGTFWEHESFDHVIRTGKFERTVRYVLNNPVKIGIVEHWKDYRWNYCRKELLERFE
jgi:REP element-mobilizing transposase RayT